jgi:transposase
MRPARAIRESDLVALEQLLKTASSKSQMQRIQCVLLRARQGMNSREVADSVGWSPGWVRQVWSAYLREGTGGLVCQERGGRHRSNLSRGDERELVERFTEKARCGGLVIVSEIHRAYEDAAGHRVPKSTVYRMLARQGWRKVAPRPHHPKNDPEACAEFKKNSPALLPAKERSKRR